MTSHRLLALAWHEDAQVLEEVAGITPLRKPRRAFDLRQWLDVALGTDTIDEAETIYCGEPGPRLMDTLTRLHPDIILVFHGPSGAHSRQFASALFEIAGWGYLNNTSPTFIFVAAIDCPLGDCYDGSFRDCLQTQTTLTAGLPAAQHLQQLSRAISELQGCLRKVTDSMGFAPSVGLGVFLICSDTGQVHLTQRRDSPGPRNIGTIGGTIYAEESIERTLRKRVRDRFIGEVGDFWLGPLLSCTNMTRRADNKRHYVDLTFLATVTRKPGKIQSPRHHPIDDDGAIWFPFSRVAELSAQERLFPPVENAYQALRRMLASHVAVWDRNMPLVNMQMLTEPGISQIVREFEDADMAALLNGRAPKLQRLSGFLFDQSVSQ